MTSCFDMIVCSSDTLYVYQLQPFLTLISSFVDLIGRLFTIGVKRSTKLQDIGTIKSVFSYFFTTDELCFLNSAGM